MDKRIANRLDSGGFDAVSLPRTRREIKRRLRMDIERHRGKSTQCIFSAWYWRSCDGSASQDAFRSVVRMARDSSRAAQRAIRDLREIEQLEAADER